MGIGAASAGPVLVSVYDVAAGVSNTPASATGPFGARGTITNTGSFAQDAGSKLIISANGGKVTGAPGDCGVSGGVATCVVGALASGASISKDVTITPNDGVASVTAQADVVAANPELNVLPDSANNTAVSNPATNIVYSVDVAGYSSPAEVLNGSDALVTASVTSGPVGQTISLTFDTTNAYDPALALQGCDPSADPGTVVCTAAYGPNETKSFDVAVTSLTTDSSITTTLTANGAGNASDTFSVVTGLSPDAKAFVPATKKLTDKEPKLSQTFSVPPKTEHSAPGLVLDLNQGTVPPGTMCGLTTPCANFGAEALFGNTGTYSSDDLNNPFLWDINFGRLTCNGGGTPKCTDILYFIGSGKTTAQKVLKCVSYGQLHAVMDNVDTPCLQNAVKTAPGQWVFTIALLKDIIIPPIGGITG